MSVMRQGDVLLVPVKAVPGTATKQRKTRRTVLAEGEATGHAHVIESPDVRLYEVIEEGDVAEMRQRFLEVEAEVALDHDEHATITVQPGLYEIRRQREYTPVEIRRVAD